MFMLKNNNWSGTKYTIVFVSLFHHTSQILKLINVASCKWPQNVFWSVLKSVRKKRACYKGKIDFYSSGNAIEQQI